MLYPTQCVDGRVHQEGGAALRDACAALPEQSPGVRCPAGSAALTHATGNLASVYRFVLHAVAPFRSDERWEPRLLASFIRTFDLILFLVGARESGHLTVSVPLLGSGARGGGNDECAEVAARAVKHFGSQVHQGGGLVLRFAVVDADAQHSMEQAFGRAAWVSVADGRTSPSNR